MEKYDVAIIGAGLGGLECAYILAKAGKKVIVLEKNKQYLGGCLQTFERKGHKFDTGFHYVGGLDEGQPLNRIFKYFGLMDLPWKKMDEDCFDEVIYKGKSYKFKNGYDAFLNQMVEYFPHQKANLEKYVADLKEIGDNIFDSLNKTPQEMMDPNSPFVRKALPYLRETFSDEDLINVLSGTSPKMPLNEKLPLYHFLQINASFIKSAYRLCGGGMQIADSLVDSIKSFSKENRVLLDAKVTKLNDEGDGIVRTVEYESKSGVRSIIEVAEAVISNIHPASFIPMISGTKVLRSFQYKTQAKGDNSFGMFTANLAIKPNTLKYQNRNIYIHESSDVWGEAWQAADNKPSAVLVSFAVPKEGDYVDNIDILTPMLWSDVAKFDGTEPMKRGKEYDDFKRSKTNQLLDVVERYMPDIKDCIDWNCVWESTPLTYKDYTGTAEGSAYGLSEKKFSQRLSLTTNVYWTGQNIGLHGFLGVSMTSLLTVKHLLEPDVFESMMTEILNK
ncbi:MAG: NAD(P)/FAD-dependent oxidoreductase [Bacteroidales bacterium]|nr:NAD(P)/FAD-dependent oxidoreductase [Bacteroidales bacterium]